VSQALPRSPLAGLRPDLLPTLPNRSRFTREGLGWQLIETVELLVEAFEIGNKPLVITDSVHRICASSTPLGHRSILARIAG
jgi:hypothetical protein